MFLSNWFVSPLGNFSRTGLLSLSSPLRVVYLDDHKLFRGTVVNYCIKPFFKNMDIIEFENGDDTYDFIKTEIGNNNKIDLIITDINHPGLRGQELVKYIRFHEGLSVSSKRIPIIMLTMVDETRYPELVEDKIVDSYLSKATEPEDIIDCMEEILYD